MPIRLTDQQKRHFIDEGYLVVPGLIPPEIVEATCRALWDALKTDPGDPATWPEQRIIAAHEIHDLMKPCRTPAMEAWTEAICGPHFHHGGGFSPVINFPRPGPARFEPLGFHIDGIDETTLWPGRRYLVGLVYLSDAPEHGGALAVRPGSHRQLLEYWYVSGTGPDGQTKVPDLAYRDPIPVPGEAGDVVFLHYLLAHGSSENHANRPRIALNSAIGPSKDRPYQRRLGPPREDWTLIDHTLRTDDLRVLVK